MSLSRVLRAVFCCACCCRSKRRRRSEEPTREPGVRDYFEGPWTDVLNNSPVPSEPSQEQQEPGWPSRGSSSYWECGSSEPESIRQYPTEEEEEEEEQEAAEEQEEEAAVAAEDATTWRGQFINCTLQVINIQILNERPLEELEDRIVEVDMECPTEAILDRPATPLFIPAKSGRDVATQTSEGELFDFDIEVRPMLEGLVEKSIKQALLEVREEEELANLRAHQCMFHELRRAELAEVQRLEEHERRHQEEKLFDLNIKVRPMLEGLVGKSIEQALLEVRQKEELVNLRAHQCMFHELRHAELAEVQCLEEQDRRHQELFDLNIKVRPMLEGLVEKSIEQALLEVRQKEELANLWAHQCMFHELRRAELAEVQRLEEQERRHREEKLRRKKQQLAILKMEKETSEKIAARAFAQRYLPDLIPSVCGSLQDSGYFFDPVERDIEIGYLPWLMDKVEETIERRILGGILLDSLIRDVMEKRLNDSECGPMEMDPKPSFEVVIRPELSDQVEGLALPEASAEAEVSVQPETSEQVEGSAHLEALDQAKAAEESATTEAEPQ